ncbi:hypothetical protein SAMN04488498_104361 [Mesorhizobium albiziae]|uniref:DNA cytosine methyltransferase n=1 Tax=Neomesorhizobium albiziae TaxID=335020 RepID=A0A1I3YF21_9HYPH|nr:hypothetical protein [Mesorhizobium albiziae]GLS29933.1 hypothetical protein GCM10007937_16410 [Mesorhizobium albiziae]SFK29786.1 hypothetical protein SAMN04488498_104361 [Mesorhizobium albiziae]
MRSLRILVACEFTGTVRRAFAARGYDAWSCDLLPAEDGNNKHLIGDVRNHLNDGWDMLVVAHPPCTRLCNSGVRWLSAPPRGKTLDQMWNELDEGAALFSDCWNAPIERVAVENPVMHKHARARIRNYQPPAQTVQPWWFGDPEFKATGLYLRGLPPLTPTNKLTPPAKGTDEHRTWSRVHRMPPGPNRGKERSRFFPGVADAMADQWGAHALAEMERAAA